MLFTRPGRERCRLEATRLSAGPSIEKSNERPGCMRSALLWHPVMGLFPEEERQLQELGVNLKDLEESFSRSAGPGGQNVNKALEGRNSLVPCISSEPDRLKLLSACGTHQRGLRLEVANRGVLHRAVATIHPVAKPL